MGVQRQEPLDQTRCRELRLRQGGPPGRDVLLLRLRRRLRARLHQDLHLLPLSGKGVVERARVGQAPGRSRGRRLHRTLERLPVLSGPGGLQAICDRFGPDDIEAFFARWTAVIPTPFTEADRDRRVLLGAVDAPSRGLAARSCSTTPAGRGGSSRPSSPTTSASAVPSRSGPCSSRPSEVPTQLPIPDPGLQSRAPTSTSTSPTSTAGSSNTSRKGGRFGSRPSSTSRPTSGSSPGSSTCPNSSPRPARSTTVCL